MRTMSLGIALVMMCKRYCNRAVPAMMVRRVPEQYW